MIQRGIAKLLCKCVRSEHILYTHTVPYHFYFYTLHMPQFLNIFTCHSRTSPLLFSPTPHRCPSLSSLFFRLTVPERAAHIFPLRVAGSPICISSSSNRYLHTFYIPQSFKAELKCVVKHLAKHIIYVYTCRPLFNCSISLILLFCQLPLSHV